MKCNPYLVQPGLYLERPSSWLLGLLGFLLILGCLLVGCRSGGETESADGQMVEVGDQKYKVRDLRSGGRSLRITPEERREIRRTIAKLATEYSSDNPNDWQRTTEKIKKFGKKFVPDIVRKKTKIATKRGQKGTRARKQLVRWGELKKIVLKLPAKKEEVWDRVREQMFAEGPQGKEMFISHMIQFLRSADQNRTHAARQLSKSGEMVVRQAWDTAKKMARKARRTEKKDKAIQGAMITIQGLCEVLVFSENWQYINRALDHRFYRIRGGMVNALTKLSDSRKAIRILSEKIKEDPNAWVRVEAVSAVSVFDAEETAVNALKPALLDDHPKVSTTAAKKLRHFPQLEERVRKILIETLKTTRDRPLPRRVQKEIFATLRDVTENPPSNDSYRSWISWNRDNRLQSN